MAREQARAHEPPIRLVLATDRPVVLTFFERLAADRPRFEVHRIPVSADRLDLGEEELVSASVALVDLGLDPDAGARVCEELARLHPDLPVAAVVCCPDSATARNLRVLLARGVDSILDLQGTTEETRRAVETLAGGGSVLQLRLRRGQRTVLASMLTGGPPTGETQVRLLELVACGLSEREIGQRLHLSPHTVKHQIEGLRHDLGVRNRTELAAWAGQHGFYSVQAGEPRRLHVQLPDRAPA